MSQAPDDLPLPEEFEMACEDEAGKAFTGYGNLGQVDAAERVAALERRIVYLRGQIAKCLERMEEDHPQADELLAGAKKDLANAQRLLAEWKAQDQGRN